MEHRGIIASVDVPTDWVSSMFEEHAPTWHLEWRHALLRSQMYRLPVARKGMDLPPANLGRAKKETLQWIMSRKCWESPGSSQRGHGWGRWPTGSTCYYLNERGFWSSNPCAWSKISRTPRCPPTWATTLRLRWVKLDSMHSRSSLAFATFSCSSRARSQLCPVGRTWKGSRGRTGTHRRRSMQEAWRRHICIWPVGSPTAWPPSSGQRRSIPSKISPSPGQNNQQTNKNENSDASTNKIDPGSTPHPYFNEDLTKEEQARRKTLVPVYKELHKRISNSTSIEEVSWSTIAWSSITMKLGVFWTEIRFRRRCPLRLRLLLPNSPSPRLPQQQPSNRGAFRGTLLPSTTTIRPLPLTWTMNTWNHDHFWKFPN